MKTFEATVRVIRLETWTVDAKNKAEARNKISKLSADVERDKTGGEIVDLEVIGVY